MNKEIRIHFLTFSCLIYKIIAMTTTIPPEEHQEVLAHRKVLGKSCASTCGQQDLHSTCHAPYKSSCTEYVQCAQTLEGNTFIWIGEKRSCSHGTFFSRADKACVSPTEANCTTDKCYLDRNTLNIVSYASSSGCRTYWQCVGEGENRISIPKCCGLNESYSEVKSDCVKNHTCMETCYLDQSRIECANKTRWGPGCANRCPVNCIDGQCNAKDGRCKCIPGWTGQRCDYECKIKKYDNCPAGTVFREDLCTCARKESSTPATTGILRHSCKAIVYIDFAPPSNSYSLANANAQVTVSNFNIEIPSSIENPENVYGEFNGNSAARIWAFSGNTNMINKFAARIKFKQEGASGGENQTLLSNCYERVSATNNQNAPIHIKLLTKLNKIEISAFTEDRETESFSLDYQGGQWNILEFYLARKRMQAKVMDESGTIIDQSQKMMKNTILTGSTMQVGKCQTSNGFVGLISEFSLYLCNPGWFKT